MSYVTLRLTGLSAMRRPLEILPVDAVSAPGKPMKISLKLRFSCTTYTTCSILLAPVCSAGERPDTALGGAGEPEAKPQPARHAVSATATALLIVIRNAEVRGLPIEEVVASQRR